MQPPQGVACETMDLSSGDPESVLHLLQARLRLGNVEGQGCTLEPFASTGLAEGVASSCAPPEMTPTPMTVSQEGDSTGTPAPVTSSTPTPPEPLLRMRRAVMSALRESSSPNDPSGEPSLSYHPPRPPPESLVPPTPSASISVAPEYDPKAPTKPRFRRVSTVPAPPLLLGLDRMLVWGLVLGGLFVAITVVLVHHVALRSATSQREPVPSRQQAGQTLSEPEPEDTQPESRAMAPAMDAGMERPVEKPTRRPLETKPKTVSRPAKAAKPHQETLWFER